MSIKWYECYFAEKMTDFRDNLEKIKWWKKSGKNEFEMSLAMRVKRYEPFFI